MHDQPNAPPGSSTRVREPRSLEEPSVDEVAAPGDLVERGVATLSAAVLRFVRRARQETQELLAARAGISPSVVGAAEDGTHPVWLLEHNEFDALADAVSADCPWLSGVFETAAACDLVLSLVLAGEQTMATDVLAQPCSRYMARSMLRWAVGSTDNVWSAPGLGDWQLALLIARAAALAASGSPDSWLGTEILRACGDERP